MATKIFGIITKHAVLKRVVLPLLGIYACVGNNPVQLAKGVLAWIAVVILLRINARQFRSQRRKSGSPTDKLNVLLVGDAFPPKVDGVATFAVHTMKELQRKGHSIEVLTSVTQTPELYGARVTRLPGTRLKYAPEHAIAFPIPWTCFWLLYRMKPDVVHMFEYSGVSGFMALYCALVGIPCTWSHHTRIDLYLNVVEFPWYIPKQFQHSFYATTDPFFGSFVDGHLAVCKNLYKKLKFKYGFDNVRLWKTGVSENFKPSNFSAEVRERLSGGHPDFPLILHVGRITPDKQSEQMFPVWKRLYEKLEGKVRFAVVGDGHKRVELQQQLEGAGIPCHFTGFLTGDPLLQAFASADVFFSPSLYETYPIVFLEAMRSGVSVVGPAETGTADTFEHGVHGCYYDYKSPTMVEEASSAIVTAIRNKEKFGLAGTTHVTQLTWEAVNNEIEELLIEVANGAMY